MWEDTPVLWGLINVHHMFTVSNYWLQFSKSLSAKGIFVLDLEEFECLLKDFRVVCWTFNKKTKAQMMILRTIRVFLPFALRHYESSMKCPHSRFYLSFSSSKHQYAAAAVQFNHIGKLHAVLSDGVWINPFSRSFFKNFHRKNYSMTVWDEGKVQKGFHILFQSHFGLD